MLRVLRPQDLLHLQGKPADPGQSVLHPLALGPQLLRIGQVPVGAAAASARMGTLRLHAVRRWAADLHDLSGAGGFHHLRDPQVNLLPPDGMGHKHHRAVHPRDPQPVAGIAVDHRRINRSFFQCFHGIFHPFQVLKNFRSDTGRECRVDSTPCGFFYSTIILPICPAADAAVRPSG